MLNLTAFATHNKTTVYTLITLMTLYGVSAYFNLPKQQDPGFTIRAAVVTTRFPGASPQRVEQLVTDKIEKAIQEMPELDNVTSESQPGFSFVTANFKERYTDMRPIFDKLRRKIGDIDDLPDGIPSPIVNDEYGDVFGSVYALTGDGFSYAELKDIADEIRDRLLKIDQIAKVEIQGVQDEEIYVEYNNARLKELGLAPQQLSQILGGVNIIQGGGNIRTGRERITLEPTGNYETLDDLRKTIIQLPGSSNIVHLEDIANIYRDYEDPPKSYASFNGQRAIILALSLREGGNILELGGLLDLEIPDIEADYPLGITLTPVFQQAWFVNNAIDKFANNLLQAVAIVIIIMLLFLGMRTGLIVATLLPVTIFVAFMLMKTFGITINQISLAALIIALGLLIDNAIVMAETILVRREQGEEAIPAAIAAGREMAIPLLTSSLTTTAAFLPIFLAESAVGEYTADIFKVVTIALLASWLLAMTLIPILTISFMRVKKSSDTDHFDSRFYRSYDNLLNTALHHRLLFLLLIVAIFYSAIFSLRFVPKVFIPPRTDPVITGNFSMPRGTAIETTKAIADDLENFISEYHYLHSADPKNTSGNVVRWATWLGESAPRYILSLNPGSSDPSAFNMVINTTSHLVIPETIKSVQDYAFDKYPDLEVQLRKLENGTPIPYPVVVRVSGPDIAELNNIMQPVKDKLWSTTGILSVNDDWGPRSKKLLIDINQARARRAGVTSEDVAVSLQAGLSGMELTQFREGDDLIPVTMRSIAGDRQDISKLDGLTVFSQSTGQNVPLRQVADINIAWQPGIIKRRSRDRTIAIQAQLLPGVTATDINSSFLPWLEEQSENWPRRYKYEIGGESETSGDANKAIADKLPIAGMIILLLLVAQFNNVRKPLIILMTIPLGLIGVIYGLLIAQSIFGFFTILGIISLSGIVINNAIVLIDRITLEINENKRTANDAIFTATKQRLRPILLTTATTIGGMLPLWISHDPMFETMSVTIIFGLLFATVLTLFVVPVLYSVFFREKLAEH